MVRRIVLVCGVVSSVLYVATDVLASLLYPGYGFADQEFSGLCWPPAPRSVPS